MRIGTFWIWACLLSLSMLGVGCENHIDDMDDDDDTADDDTADDDTADDDTADDDTGDDDTGDDDTGDDDTSDDDTGDDDTGPQDNDGDGWPFGEDCNDFDASLNYDDADKDQYASCDGDCDDFDPGVHPGAPEGCDGIDTDCTGAPAPDELDVDQDKVPECAGDCNDNNAAMFPGNKEICDGFDNDCDGGIDNLTDMDQDGYSICSDCDDKDPDIHPGQPEDCKDGIDNNCNGLIDEAGDQDNDGYNACVDCDDTNPLTYPGGYEVCGDNVDNNCDGQIDEGVDDDNDGVTTCDGDCDDTDPTIYPGAPEDNCAVPADGLDNDCDGETDEGCTSLVIDPPAYVYDSLEFTLLTGDPTMDSLLNMLLQGYMPPSSNNLIVIFDPTTGPWPPAFSARWGGGWLDPSGTYDWDPQYGVPVEFLVNMQGLDFDSFGAQITGVFSIPVLGTLTLYNLYVEGTFTMSMARIDPGELYGQVSEADAAQIPDPIDPTQTIADMLNQNRVMDADTDGDGVMDGWTVEANYTAFEF